MRDILAQALRQQAPQDPYQSQRQQIMSQMIREMGKPAPEAPKFESYISEDMVRNRVNELRDNNRTGRVLMASGDQALGQVGKSMVGQDPMQFLQDVDRQRQVREYQQWQANQGRKGNRLRDLATSLNALPNPPSTNRLRQSRMPHSAQRDGMRSAEQLRTMRSLNTGFKDRNQQVFGEILSAGPMKNANITAVLNGLESVIAESGVTDRTAQEMRDAASWWSEFNRRYVGKTRNELFGATLTPSEEKAWQTIQGITPASTATTVRQQLNKLERELAEGARERAELFSTQYGVAPVLAIYGNEEGDGFLFDGYDQEESPEDFDVKIDSSGRTTGQQSSQKVKTSMGEIMMEAID